MLFYIGDMKYCFCGFVSAVQDVSAAQDAAQENFVRLVNACFVERCPAPEPLLEEPPEQEGPKKPRGKSAKVMELDILCQI